MAMSLKRASTITSSKTHWLWKPFIPRGCLTILDGDPGSYKTTITIDLAARITTGRAMPLEKNPVASKPAAVFMYEGEGNEEYTAHMLKAAGANMDCVFLSYFDEQGSLALPDDLPQLAKKARIERPKLIVLDPATYFIKGGVNNETAVRRALTPLTKLAAEIDAAVILVRHLKKGSRTDPAQAGVGSISLTGIARSVLLVGKDPTGDARFALTISKTNLAKKPEHAVIFRPSDIETNVTINWLGRIPLSAHDILQGTADEDGRLGEAINFLREYLAEGTQPAETTRLAAEQMGISRRTLARARSVLHVKSERVGGHGGYHELSLPPDPLIKNVQHEQQRVVFLEEKSRKKRRRIDRRIV